ncbi:PIG-L family deacetylase, partial [Peptostreptococcaceae bacterium OttesenSCG-928-C18]|nr:PIG-L family deacetylase [Peptostreptococcaceae bacterium OttesenSCG-928-C18]
MVFYLNPHQDDEVVKYGLDIIRDVRAGKKIYFIQVTNGGASGVGENLGITQEQMINSRNLELEGALKEMGLDKSNITYLDLKNDPIYSYEVKDNPDKINPKIDTIVEEIDSIIEYLIEIEGYNEENIEIKTTYESYEVGGAKGFGDHWTCREAGIKIAKKYNIKLSFYTIERYSINHNYSIPRFNLATEEEKSTWNRAIDKYKFEEGDEAKGIYGIGFLSAGNSLNSRKGDNMQYKYLI